MVCSVYIYIYIYIYKLYKNYCFPNESCRKGKKQGTKFDISSFKQHISGRNWNKNIKISRYDISDFKELSLHSMQKNLMFFIKYLIHA